MPRSSLSYSSDYHQQHLDHERERALDKDEEREPRVALRRVTADDHRERAAIDLGRAFVREDGEQDGAA
jgi:hypothetical protein